MHIALDAMGTDHAPTSEVAGAVQALPSLGSDVTITFVGDEAVVEAELAKHADAPRERLRVRHAPDRVGPKDAPATVTRSKPESSIVVGLGMVREGTADAFVSAGPTGAVMAASLFILRRLEGVDRPSVGTVLPTAESPVLLLDAGANIDCKPDHLVQFAHLGHIYAQDILEVESPRVGLLNVGEEPGKGDERAIETYQRLTGSSLNFVGNVEGRDIILGTSDVVVCDGFVGNVLLKFYETVAGFIITRLEAELKAKIPDLELPDVFQVLDWAEYGGAPLLGVNGVSIICHGSSPPKAIRSALREATRAVRSSLVDHLAGELRAYPGDAG